MADGTPDPSEPEGGRGDHAPRTPASEPVGEPSRTPAPEPPPTAPRTYVTSEAYGAVRARAPRTPAQAALPWFVAGVLVAVATSVLGWRFLHTTDSSAAWWWGAYLVAVALWRTAWSQYSEARAETGQGLGAVAVAVVVIGSAVAVGSVVVLSATSFVWRAPPTEFGVGSCWSEDGGRLGAVPCGDRSAAYAAIAEAAAPDRCPGATRATVPAPDVSRVLCLARR